MSTYGGILADVLLIVPAPEREALIRSKINEIIRYISCSGKFWRDIEETTIGSTEGVVATDNIQNIPITSVVRSLVYVTYPTTVTDGTLITCVHLEGLIGRENCSALANVAYLSGAALHIKNSIQLATFGLGIYSSPAFFLTDGTEDDQSNWITEKVPGLVVDLTAAYILNLVGDNEDAKRISNLAGLFKATYIRDIVTSLG